MKPEVVPSIVKFVQASSMHASRFRTIKMHADDGRKAPETIRRMLLQRTRGAMISYQKAFGVKIQSGCAEREAVKALAAAYQIGVDDVDHNKKE